MTVCAKTDNFILQELGSRIKKERIQQGLSQEDLAAQSGVSRVSISKMETGDNFNFMTFIKIMRALNKLEEIELLLKQSSSENLLDLFK